mgnify:CR=1 FL=1
MLDFRKASRKKDGTAGDLYLTDSRSFFAISKRIADKEREFFVFQKGGKPWDSLEYIVLLAEPVLTSSRGRR